MTPQRSVNLHLVRKMTHQDAISAKPAVASTVVPIILYEPMPNQSNQLFMCNVPETLAAGFACSVSTGMHVMDAPHQVGRSLASTLHKQYSRIFEVSTDGF